MMKVPQAALRLGIVLIGVLTGVLIVLRVTHQVQRQRERELLAAGVATTSTSNVDGLQVLLPGKTTEVASSTAQLEARRASLSKELQDLDVEQARLRREMEEVAAQLRGVKGYNGVAPTTAVTTKAVTSSALPVSRLLPQPPPHISTSAQSRPPKVPQKSMTIPVPTKPATATGTATASTAATIPTAVAATAIAKTATALKPTPTPPSQTKGACPYDFTVYVYPLPTQLDSVRLAEEARRNRTLHVCQKCILEQFALEYIVHDFFTQFCGRVTDPALADYFYLPIIRDAEYRVRLDEHKNPKKRNPSPVESALLLLMEKNDSSQWRQVFNLTDEHWRRSGGGNHIIAMPAPVTNLRHESSMRGFFHYMSHLHTPIFLNVEYSITFVHEYPVCAAGKNIVLPYPTTDPDLFNGKLHAAPVNRSSLLYYAGGLHGECMEIRRAMRQIMINSTKIDRDIVPHVRTTMTEREHGFRAATFCPVPVGDSPSSKRMYDVMHFGCIPVVISDDLVWAFSPPAGDDVDPREFSIQIPQSVVQFPADVLLRKFSGIKGRAMWGNLPDGESLYGLLEKSQSLPAYEKGIYVNPLVHLLRLVSPENVRRLQAGVAKYAPEYHYYRMDTGMQQIPTAVKALPNGLAIERLAKALSQRKSKGLAKLRDQCQEERFRRGHKYIPRHPCDKDDATSLKRRRLSTVDADVLEGVGVGEGESASEDEKEVAAEADCSQYFIPGGECKYCGDWKL